MIKLRCAVVKTIFIGLCFFALVSCSAKKASLHGPDNCQRFLPKSQLSIVYLSDVYTPYISGVVTSINNSAKELLRNGHRVAIITSEYEGLKPVKDGPEVFALPSTDRTIKYPGMRTVLLSSKWQCLKILEKIKPDILHVHTPSYLGKCADIYSKQNNIPLINTYHTSLVKSYKHIPPLRILPQSIAVWLVSKFTKNYYNNSDYIFAPSQVAKDELVSFGVNRPIKVISNGIDLGVFAPLSGIESKSNSILHVGRLAYEKNVDIVIKAFAQVYAQIPQARLTIIGDGPELASLQRLSHSLGLVDKVSFLGAISHDFLNKYYNKSEIFVTASTVETEGLVLLEAMAAGMPIVGVDALAIPYIVENGKNGFIVPPFDEKAMADRIIQILQDPGQRLRMKAAAVDKVKEYSLSGVAIKIEQIYKQLASSCL